MSQPVFFKYGDTASISTETVQQGKLLIDYEAQEISIDKDGTNRVVLTTTPITVDSDFSTTSTNPLRNSKISNAFLNTMANVMSNVANFFIASALALKEYATIKKGTLTAGQTSITITDARITTDSVLDFYTSIWGVNPLTVTTSTGQVVLTFDVQATNMDVGVGIGGYVV